MRVTDAQLYATTRLSLSRAKEDLANAQEQAATGLRVQKPSDDPVAAAAARRERNTERLAEAGQRGIELANATLLGSDEALSQMQEVLSRARELATQGASGTIDAAGMRLQLSEVQQLRDQLVVAGNAQVAGSYVFGGFRDGTSPFDSSGQYSGDDSVRSIEVLPGVRVETSVSGAKALGIGGAGVDVFAALAQLEGALQNGDRDAVRSTLTDLVAGEKQVIEMRGRAGTLLDGLEVARSVAEQRSAVAVTERARLTEADEFDAISQLMRAKAALEAAVATAGQIPAGGLASRGR